MRIATVVGARPQFIKSGPVSRALDRVGIEETLIHTGQHYDLNMSDVFFETMGLRAPAHHLGLGAASHGKMTGDMLAAIEDILINNPVDGLLVYGDTNSTLAGALAAAKLHVPVFHVEAGLRSFNRRMPEEINRVLTDHVSSLLFCPTPVAVDHLRAEGVVNGVHMVGDVMKDGIDYTLKQIGERESTSQRKPGSYYLATVHRQENVDHPDRLSGILNALALVDRPVVLPLHPRTRAKLASNGDLDTLSSNIEIIDPIGYVEMLQLLAGAHAMLTDSGGVQKEAYMMGVPCVTLRDETEWVETVESGWNTLAGANTEAIVAATQREVRQLPHPDLYGDGKASERIVELISNRLQD